MKRLVSPFLTSSVNTRPVTLPGRRFFDPLAAALIETRRDLLWSTANAARSAQILKAVTHLPEGFIRNEIGLPIVERPIDRTEITICDEFFMTGTAAQVVAVTRVDHRPIGTGFMGPVVSKVRDLYEDIVRGKNQKYSQWNMEV